MSFSMKIKLFLIMNFLRFIIRIREFNIHSIVKKLSLISLVMALLTKSLFLLKNHSFSYLIQLIILCIDPL